MHRNSSLPCRNLDGPATRHKRYHSATKIRREARRVEVGTATTAIPTTLALLLFLLLASCLIAGHAEAGEAKGKLLLYLNIDDPELTGGDFSLQAGEVSIRGDGDWFDLAASMRLAGGNGNGQHLAATVELVENTYREIRLMDLHIKGGSLSYDSEQLVLPIASRLTVSSGRTTALFLTIPAGALQQPKEGGLPMGAAGGRGIFHADLCFASVPSQNTIFVISADKGRVIATVDGGKRPGSLIVDRDRDRLHVLDLADRTVNTLELTSGNLSSSLHVPMLQNPSVMIATRDNHVLLLDGDRDQAGLVDLGRGELSALQRFRATPRRAAYLADAKVIAVTVPESQEIILLDESSLTVQGEVLGGVDASDVVVFEDNFIVSGGNSLIRINPAGGQKEKRLQSTAAAFLVADDRFLYAALVEEQAVGIIFPRQLTIAKRIALGAAPGEMAISRARNLLFAAVDQGIAILDLTGQKVIATIDIGDRPSSLAATR